MADREKVIRAMEYCTADIAHVDENDECLGDVCPFKQDGYKNGDCYENMIRAALALLKEQEPRVMTWEEIKESIGIPVWVEYADNENWNGYGVPTSDYKAYIMIYGANAYCGQYARSCNVKWRAWTSRPSEQQMRETKWEEMP